MQKALPAISCFPPLHKAGSWSYTNPVSMVVSPPEPERPGMPSPCLEVPEALDVGMPGLLSTLTRWRLPRVWNLLSPAAEACSLSTVWDLPTPADELFHCRVRFRKLTICCMAPLWRTRKEKGSGGCEPVGFCPFPNEGMALLSFN